jgi:hypothetical protein
MRGQYFFFFYPEWQLYGGVGVGVAALAAINVIALSSRSYIWIRVSKFLWPFIIVICGVRAIIMIVRLQQGKDKIAWECAHGGQLWSQYAQDNTSNASIPAGFCSAGFHNLYIAYIFGLLIDLGFQMYMFFLTWRFSKRLEHYSSMKGPFAGGYYNY